MAYNDEMAIRSRPKVSVVITCYNYAAYIAEAIESVLGQVYKNIELIVIDDGSTDASLEVINKYDKSIKIITRENKGIVHTRNEGIEIADGDFLLFLDADDWIDSKYVETLVQAAEKNNLDVAYCDARYFMEVQDDMSTGLNPPKFNIERLKNGNFVHMSSLIRLSAIKDIRFDKDTEKITHEDWDFFLNLALNGLRFGRVEGVALNYRVKPLSRSDGVHNEIGVAQLYKFIYEKYSKLFPDDMEYLAYHRLADDLINNGEELIKVTHELKDTQQELHALSDEYAALRKSRSYRFGQLAAKPVRKIRRLMNK